MRSNRVLRFPPTGTRSPTLRAIGAPIRSCSLDLDHGQTRTLHTGAGIGSLSFSRDGKRLLATINRNFLGESVIAIDIASTATETLFPVSLWSPRPSFAADGRSVYYC